MPMPTPNSGESEQEFISRCMGTDSMQEYDQDQRAAVCYSQWRDKDKKGVTTGDIPTDLSQSIEEEIQAASDYRERAEIARNSGDAETADLYEHIAQEEIVHQQEFSDRLNALQPMEAKAMSKNIIRKILTTQVKLVQGKERVLEFIGSTEGMDRDGEVIKAEAWQIDKYVKNPVVQWAHDYSAPPIGKTLSVSRRGKDTVFEIEFASKDTYEFADTIFKLCKGGFLSATSVGFIPIESEFGEKDTDPRRTYNKVELLEISIVPVPSNPEALVTARNAGVISVKEYNNLSRLKKEPKPVTQAEIKDELDYIQTLIKEAGMSKTNKRLLTQIAKRITEGDISAEIITKGDLQELVDPVIKMINGHHDSHMKTYKVLKDTLEQLIENKAEDEDEDEDKPEDDEKPDEAEEKQDEDEGEEGKEDEEEDEDEPKQDAFRSYLAESIKEHMEVK